ncbi:MAG: CPBP family intramembrane metalloprotease [Acidobacteriia bacterium]|nr:CPBP family intramembrane metalloprotease [Terriglobia bacterium]
MIPAGSSSEPQPVVQPPPRMEPFWDYQDLLLFFGFAIPSLLVTVLVVGNISALRVFGRPFQGLLAQLVWYGLVFGVLYGILRSRYGQPFWRSLGWRFPFRGMAIVLFGGPLLAIAIGYAGYLLRTPDIEVPFREMLGNRPTLLLFALFVVILGPLCEELAFRGFMMPLLVRSFGAAAGIIGTGALFGCLHAPEYAWSWRHALLITTAGSVFGWVRYKTGSTAAATVMHAGYNLTQLAAFLAQS